MNPLLRRHQERFYQRHPAQTLLILLSMSVAIGLVAAIELVNHSALQAMNYASSETLGNTTHQIHKRGGGRFDQANYVALKRQSGLTATPVLEARLNLAELGQLEVIGVDPIAENTFQRASSGDALPGDSLQAMLLGEPLLLTTPVVSEQTVEDRVSGQAVRLEPLLDSRLGRVVVADLGLLQRLADAEGQLSRIDLVLDENQAHSLAESLDEALSLSTTMAGDPGADGMIAAFQLNLRALALLSLLVAGLLVANSMRFLVLQRGGDFATLRALGQRPGEQLRGVLLEACVLGLLGGLAGLALGYWLAGELLGMAVRTLSDVYLQSLGEQLMASPRIAVTALLLAMLASIAGAWLPALELRRQSVAGALTGQMNERLMLQRLPRLALLGLFMSLAGLLLVLFGHSLAWQFPGLFLLAIGYSLASLQAIAWIAAGLAHRGPGMLRLPGQLLKSASARLGSGMLGLSLAVATVVSIAVMISSFRTSTEDWLTASLYAPFYLSAHADQPLQQTQIEQLRSWPQSQYVLAGAASQLSLAAGQRFEVSIISPAQPRLQAFQTANGPPIGDLEQDWQGLGGVLVSESLARRQHWQPGDQIELASGQNLTVLAWVRDYRSPMGRLFIHWQTAQSIGLDAPVTSLGLIPQSGQQEALRQRLDHWLDNNPTLDLFDRQRIGEESMEIFDQTFRITHVLHSLAAVVAALAMFGALLNWQLARVSDLALLRAMGLSPWAMLRLLLAQALIIGLLTGLLALPLGLGLAIALIEVINLQSFGWSMQFSAGASELLGGLLIALLAALGAALPAALHATRQPPARHLGGQLT